MFSHYPSMNWFIILLLSLGIVAVAELGDKTQLMTISLASKYHKTPVFWGIFLGMSVITIVGVVVGTVLYRFIPIFYIKIVAAFIFIIFGLYSLYKEETEDKKDIDKKRVFTTSFFLSMVAEFGDKTQLVVIALTARFQSPIIVLIGSISGLAIIIIAGVFLGSKLSEVVEKDKIELIAALLFIILGVAFLLEPFLF